MTDEDSDSKGEMYVSGGPYGIEGADGQRLVLGSGADETDEDVEALQNGDKALSDFDPMTVLKREPILRYVFEDMGLGVSEIGVRLDLRNEVVRSALRWHGIIDKGPRPPQPPWSNDPTGADRVQPRRSSGDGGESGRNQSF